METLYARLNQIRIGFSGPIEQETCFTYIGGVLQRRGDSLRNAVIALYSIPDDKDNTFMSIDPPRTKTYLHAAIETEDGTLIAERFAPAGFRDHEGSARHDVVRSVIFVPTVMGWLHAQPHHD